MSTFIVATAPTDVDDTNDANEPAADVGRRRRSTRLECVEPVNLEYTTWWQWLLWRPWRRQRPATVQCSVVDGSGGSAGKIHSYAAVNVDDVAVDAASVNNVDAGVVGGVYCCCISSSNSSSSSNSNSNSRSCRSREKWIFLLLALVAVASVVFLAVSLLSVLRTPRNILLLLLHLLHPLPFHLSQIALPSLIDSSTISTR